MLNFSNRSPDQLYAAGFQAHLGGRYAEAERAYRQVLAVAPNHANAWHMLGALAHQAGRYREALEMMERALALDPRRADLHSNTGEVCRQLGGKTDGEEAAACLRRAEDEFKRAIALDPRLADAYTNLALLLIAQERYGEALAAAGAVLAFLPDSANAHHYLGDALLKLKRFPEAQAAYDQTLALQPGCTDARFNLGLLHMEMDRMEEAAAAFRAVIATAPEDWDARLQLAEALGRLGRGQEAYQELLALTQRNPNHAQGHSKLANMLRNSDHVDESLVEYRRAVELDPHDWITHGNMSFALRDQARLDEALAIQREVLARHPDATALHSGLIFTLQLVPGVSRAEVRREQALWNRRHADPLAGQRGHYPNSRDPGRRLRIGYVSADLRSHPVGRFMLPLLKNHDRGQVEVFCFPTTGAHDQVTGQLRQAADHFVSLGALEDEAAAAAIRAAEIDILIDLNNHTIDNRMLLFARRPAPVQISYLAFSAGTGLETIDWRLTDPHIDPRPSPDDEQAFEKPLRLAETYWCYAAPALAGAVSALPAAAAGHVTFGIFNYFSKCNEQVLALWARLLAELPAARLMLCVPMGSRQGYVQGFFKDRGIAAERLTLVGRIKEEAYFQNYGRVDVALDTFPWAGGTTTCDALYMGVPVITWAGAPGETLQRCGVSILTNLGHPEWMAATAEEYVAKARAVAADLPRLADIRAGLRERMRASPLMDAPRFARHVEAAYRQAWMSYVAGQSP
jgi:protein O-GlcNAc transferase